MLCFYRFFVFKKTLFFSFQDLLFCLPTENKNKTRFFNSIDLYILSNIMHLLLFKSFAPKRNIFSSSFFIPLHWKPFQRLVLPRKKNSLFLFYNAENVLALGKNKLPSYVTNFLFRKPFLLLIRLKHKISAKSDLYLSSFGHQLTLRPSLKGAKLFRYCCNSSIFRFRRRAARLRAYPSRRFLRRYFRVSRSVLRKLHIIRHRSSSRRFRTITSRRYRFVKKYRAFLKFTTLHTNMFFLAQQGNSQARVTTGMFADLRHGTKRKRTLLAGWFLADRLADVFEPQMHAKTIFFADFFGRTSGRRGVWYSWRSRHWRIARVSSRTPIAYNGTRGCRRRRL